MGKFGRGLLVEQLNQGGEEEELDEAPAAATGGAYHPMAAHDRSREQWMIRYLESDMGPRDVTFRDAKIEELLELKRQDISFFAENAIFSTDPQILEQQLNLLYGCCDLPGSGITIQISHQLVFPNRIARERANRQFTLPLAQAVARDHIAENLKLRCSPLTLDPPMLGKQTENNREKSIIMMATLLAFQGYQYQNSNTNNNANNNSNQIPESLLQKCVDHLNYQAIRQREIDSSIYAHSKQMLEEAIELGGPACVQLCNVSPVLKAEHVLKFASENKRSINLEITEQVKTWKPEAIKDQRIGLNAFGI